MYQHHPRVAQGVIGVALIQALLVGVIMLMASIPAVGIFFILALILGIAQVPVILVTAPAIALMWSLGTHSTGMDIFYTILLIVAGMADNVLKPLLLGRGVDAPMPVVLLGASVEWPLTAFSVCSSAPPCWPSVIGSS